MSKKTVHVYVEGKVQGVWFRASTKQEAERLGLNGWVRNTKDGRVEAIFEGSSEQVDEMIKWCHSGSSLSSVSNVTVQEMDEAINASEFNIRR